MTTLLLALTGGMLLSCSGDDGLASGEDIHPIAFSSVEAEEAAVSRAETTLGRDFVVYGYKNVGGIEQTVFDGYNIRYQAGSANTSEDNTHGYYYVGDGQQIKYWDFAASEYHFWGAWMASSDRATFSGDAHDILTIHDVPLRVGEPAPEDDVFYSELLVRYPVSADVVRLSFKRPYAKVRIQFYTTEPIETVSDNIELSNISFAPDPDAASPLVNKVYAKGDVVVTYPRTDDNCSGKATEKVVVNNYSQPQDALLFDDVTLSPGIGVSSNTAATAPIDDTEGFRLSDMPGTSLKSKRRKAGEQPGRKYYYYPLPMGEMNPAFTMSVSIDGDPELKTAVVPANFMQWKPNFFYTYIFKITEAGKKIEFYDVKIDPWKFGGSQEEEWKNW